MTIQEAKEAGYKAYGTIRCEVYSDLKDLCEGELKAIINDGELFLAEKKASPLILLPAACILEDIGDRAIEEVCECGGESVIEFVNGYEKELQALLNKIMSEGNAKSITRTYEQTDIKLKLTTP